MAHTISTCRFCGEFVRSSDSVKYGVRHYAHFHCYLDAGKQLDDLHAWQVGQFPWALLRERGLLGLAEKLTESDPDPENIYNQPSIRQSIAEDRCAT